MIFKYILETHFDLVGKSSPFHLPENLEYLTRTWEGMLKWEDS